MSDSQTTRKRGAADDRLVPMSFRIPQSVKDQAEQLAREDNRSVASVVSLAIAAYVAARRGESNP